MFSKKVVENLALQYDSFYLYDENRIAAQVENLKTHFPDVTFLYSLKCNPNPHVIRSIFSRGFGADAASLGEVKLAASCGLKRQEIFYSAPGKSAGDIEAALDCAVLIADSIGEVKRIQQIAARRGEIIDVGLRLNPAFSFSGGPALPSKFGVDESQALAFLRENDCPNVRVTGFHVHLRSQELNADILAEYYRNVLRLASRMQRVNPSALKFINMGSGLGIPYSPESRPLDTAGLGAAVRTALRSFREAFPGAKMIIETGRYVVSEAGVYATTVADRKTSCGKTYIILKNTLNGFIRPSLARLVAHYSPEASPAGAEPLFSDVNAFRFIALKGGEATEKVRLVGNLCTAADVIAEDIMMPPLECGDTVVITNAGAYAAVLSPMQFSGQSKPAELFLDVSGHVSQ